MMFWIFLIGIIVGVIGGITLVYRTAVSPLHKKIGKLTTEKQSLSTIYGKITEQFAPFMKDYPYSTQNFRFIGSPIDGIQFNDNQILFVEFKTNKSKLTNTQNKIKKLVNNGKIVWFEFRNKPTSKLLFYHCRNPYLDLKDQKPSFQQQVLLS